MSKITQAKKDKRDLEEGAASPKQKSAVEGIPNYKRCCTCIHFPKKLNGETQPCKVTGTYVARKCDKCPKGSYKCKFG